MLHRKNEKSIGKNMLVHFDGCEIHACEWALAQLVFSGPPYVGGWASRTSWAFEIQDYR